jgi:polyhydroxybutyrate depolymerase
MRLLKIAVFFCVAAACALALPALRRSDDPDLTLHAVASGGEVRWYRVGPPPALDPGERAPVVVLFHGGGGNAQQAAEAYGVLAEAVRRGWLAVFPEGTGKLGGPPLFKLETWNAGDCCGYADATDADDVGFFADMLDALERDYAVDRTRVFVTGMSNGAMLCYRIAVERPDLIAGAGPVAGSLEVGPPAAPVPLLAIHGLLDESVPVDGGMGGGISGATFTSQLESVLPFLAANGGPPPGPPLAIGQALFYASPGPEPDGADTCYLLALDGGHTWPGAGGAVLNPREPVHADVPATPLLFDFFEQIEP